MENNFYKLLNIRTTPHIIKNRIIKIQKLKKNINELKNKKVVFTSIKKYNVTQIKIKNIEKIFKKIDYRTKKLNKIITNTKNIME